MFCSSVINSICTHATTKFNQNLKYQILWNCVHAMHSIHTHKQGWSKSDCPSSWVFNITKFGRCVCLCLEVGNKGRTLNYCPIRKNQSVSLDRYTFLSTHMLGTIWREFHSQILKYLLNLVQFAGKTVHMVLERETKRFQNNKITQPAYLHPILNWVDIKWLDNHWSLDSTYNGKHFNSCWWY